MGKLQTKQGRGSKKKTRSEKAKSAHEFSAPTRPMTEADVDER